MEHTLLVKFGSGRDYELRLHDGELAGTSPQTARRWLEQQFVEMGCVPSNPTGKTLVVDLILGVARAVGDKAFAQGEPIAREFARNALAVLQRPAITIDAENSYVG
ncbi:MAG TPA: hypothetical protein VMT02_04730 [Burkholderiales bacterium]|jgi:hypothetical protein|nr:hypothetical protein [Burkholderiales bacterium]